jgi:hypothetical protein
LSSKEIEDVELALKNIRHTITTLPKEHAGRRQQLNELELEMLIWLTDQKNKSKRSASTKVKSKIPDHYIVELFLLRCRYCDAAYCGGTTHGTADYLKCKICELVKILNENYSANLNAEVYIHGKQ